MNIESGSIIALDTVVFVYFLERHRQYFEEVETLFRRIESGELNAVMSSLVFAELLVPPYRAGERSTATRTFQYLSRFPNLQTVDVNAPIAQSAARLRAEYGLRTPDALHAATALHQGADLLVTNDTHFRKTQKELPIFWIDPFLRSK